MKLKIKLSLLFFAFLIVFSCSKKENEITQNLVFNELKITLTESTNYVSSLFINMGVTKIVVGNSKDELTFKCLSEKSFFLNSDEINLSDYEVTLNDNILSLKSCDSYKISMLNNEPYLITPIYEGYLSNVGEFIKNKEIVVLFIYLKEITTETNLKINSLSVLSEDKSCSFLNTYYVFATGVSSSVASDNLAGEVGNYTGAGGRLRGCTPIGGVDTSCIWDNHACISTQAFCCK